MLPQAVHSLMHTYIREFIARHLSILYSTNLFNVILGYMNTTFMRLFSAL